VSKNQAMMKKLEEHLQKRSSKCFYINRQTHRKERFVVEEHQKMPDAMTRQTEK
jgi:hypothetical protein